MHIEKVVCVVALATVLGCHSVDTLPTVASGHGQLLVQLTGTGGTGAAQKHATLPGGTDVTQIEVTVLEVTFHTTGGGWTTLSHDTVSVNLLDLHAAAIALGLANLPAGDVTEIRLRVADTGNYVVLADGTHVDLKVPSGSESGIKIKGPFHIGECGRTIVDLVFDGPHSCQVHPTGQGTPYILRPVIRVDGQHHQDLQCTGEPDAGTGGDNNGETDGGTSGGTTSPPPPAGTGAPCGESVDCLSGLCASGVCQPGGPGAPCSSGTDCASGQCDTASGTCSTNGEVPGTGCTSNTECLSSSCVQSVCQPGGQGAPCQADTDCVQGFACIASSCTPIMLN
jgi:hypothetical protein